MARAPPVTRAWRPAKLNLSAIEKFLPIDVAPAP
jgi:hypothetical protein